MFCVVLAEPSWELIFTHIKSEAKNTDLFEIRLDFIEEELEEGALRKLFALPYRFICTYRDYREGGKRRVPPGSRWEILELCGRLGAFLIDFEWKAYKEIRALIRKSPLFPEKVLISYHNFQRTPSSRALRRYLRALKEEGVRKVKIATFARDLPEALRVLNSISEGRDLGLEVVAFSMGDQVKLSRVLSLLLGSPFTYVFPAEGKPVAPGQLSVTEAKKLYEVLRNV